MRYRFLLQKIRTYKIELACFITTFVASIFIIFNGFLHEDAYILFVYTESLAQNGIIAFDELHGASEGATDFLWMILISFFQLLKFDPGFSVGLLNAFGAALIANTLVKLTNENDQQYNHLLIFVLITLGPFTAAAISGFSTLLYCGVFAQCLYAAIQSKTNKAIYLCLILSLIRPDGVLLSTGIIIGLAINRAITRENIKSLAITFCIGCIYFLWRYNYFGELLPLPLIVKSKSEATLSGLWTNLKSLESLLHSTFLVLLVLDKKYRNKILILLLPAALLFISLSFAYQSQNIAFRFQAPIYISLIMSILIYRPGFQFKHYSLAMLFPFIALGIFQHSNSLNYLLRDSYINSFPYYLQKTMQFNEKTRVALTEAGRFPYYTNTQRIDLIGLNTKHIAKNGLSIETIRKFNPDLIFLHSVVHDVKKPLNQNYLKFSKNAFYDTVGIQKVKTNNLVYEAPVVATSYFKKSSNLNTAYIINYNGSYTHFYFANDEVIRPDIFLNTLKKSFQNPLEGHCSASNLFPCNLGDN